MKEILLVAFAILGITVVGFSQTTMEKTGVITGKVAISSTEHVYKIKDMNTGLDYESLPTQAQIAIGEHAPFLLTEDDKSLEALSETLTPAELEAIQKSKHDAAMATIQNTR